MHRQGQDNIVFTIDADRIEEVATASSSHSDLHSTGSQNVLTSSQTNFRFTNIENEEEGRVPTPTNMVRRWSQNLSKLGKGKKTIREKTIYRLPSRKLFAVEGQLLTTNELEIEQLANEIEQHDYLMQDTVTGKQIRMDTIRALPHPLTTKRRLKEKLSVSVTQHLSTSEPDSTLKRSKDIVVHFLIKFWNMLVVIFNRIEIWYDSMKEIEGHFGSSVGTYFKFLRWLFISNLIILVLTFSFIALPQILYDNYVVAPERSNFSYINLLTGEGYVRDSILFYGAYTNESVSLRSNSDGYSLPHAYFVTMLCLYLVTFVVISTSMARSYRKSFIETSGGIRSMYAHKIFCSWDFGISNVKAAQLKHKTIFHELKEVLHELDESNEKVPILYRLYAISLKFIAHLLVFIMIAGLGAGMWILMGVLNESDEKGWATLYLPLVVNVSILLLQFLFSWITKMEDYRSPRRSLHITLVRNFLLEGTVIGVLIVFWLNKSFNGCWETSIGQEIYRLVMVDFILNVLLLPLVQLFQVYCIFPYFPDMNKLNFDISQKSLGLVFNQTLLWVGLFFSPLLSLVMALKMIIMFYVKKMTLIHLSKSPTQLWRSAQTQTLYLVFTFLSLLGVIITHGYIMTQVPVSEKCGPFRGYDFMFQIFIDGVLKLKENHWIWRCIMIIGRPAVMGGILLSMIVIVYYLRSKSKARKAMVKLLKDMLYLEAKDKEFLLSNITKVTQDREWLFEDNTENDTAAAGDQPQGQEVAVDADNLTESCLTWKYQKNGPKRTNLMKNDECILRSRHI